MQNLAALPAALLPWYAANARNLPWRADTQPYHIWLSEIMLQQTRVEAVRGYYMRFLAALPTIAHLAAAEEDFLLKLWEGLGYYSRARNLQRAARQIMELHGGAFPREYAALRALPGIGEYTAGAIASICFEQPIAAVDGNVLRVISRVTADDTPIGSISVKRQYAKALSVVYPAGQCGAFTQSLMELGATVCLPGTPHCAACPLAGALCAAHAQHIEGTLPIMPPKRPRAIEQRTVFVLVCEGCVAICKRGPKGLLAGLWQLPNLPGELTEAQALAQASQWGARPIAPDMLLRCTHKFTHIEWRMACYRIRCTHKAPCFTWASEAQLRGEYALPTAFRLFLTQD
ncbi:MAG: A/G-specific adenine glycosylase [Christensenellaceae bacterium]|nr:A/G-specific adenine glycosylase [Christensenellaceae bacterium]